VRSGVDLLQRLRFPETTRVVDVDGEAPLGEVLLKAKQAVWETI